MIREKKPAVALTDALIRSITPPAVGQETHHDALLPSFGLRVSAGGAKTWIIQRRVDGKPRRFKLGRYPGMPLAAARDAARRIIEVIDSGKDPEVEAAREREEYRRQCEAQRRLDACTFRVVRDRFIEEYGEGFKADGKTPHLRPRSLHAYKYTLHRKWFKDWEHRPLTEINRGDVRALLAAVHKKHGGYTANRLLALLRKMLNWAVSQDLIESSPCAGFSRLADEIARERVLHERELFHLWRAFDAAPVFAAPLKLLLLTAQRRGEVAGMESGELENMDGDAPLWRIQKHRAKNDRAHAVPLSPLAAEILAALPAKSGLMFTTTGETPVSGLSKAKDNINAYLADQHDKHPDPAIASLLADWRIHDFRRTAATCMAEIGTSRDVVEAILNHKSGTRAGVAGIYNRSELLDDRRIALEVWAKYLQRVTAEPLSDQAVAALRAELKAEHRRRLMGEVPQRLRLQSVERLAA